MQTEKKKEGVREPKQTSQDDRDSRTNDYAQGGRQDTKVTQPHQDTFPYLLLQLTIFKNVSDNYCYYYYYDLLRDVYVVMVGSYLAGATPCYFSAVGL